MTANTWHRIGSVIRLMTCGGMAASALAATDLHWKWKTMFLVLLFFLTVDSLDDAHKAFRQRTTSDQSEAK